ncbi:hypothetical protein HPP92_018738 [Vanilla planifolia]|uniref:Exostosin GT47 domain-containing protein n=1 Tax=Vanilla planifolia TaxID=51239 RepID=A0A835Q9D0_VANPL|nr:hypothetical protein HPP92_018738 [Vanilla planifolia]
MGTPFSSSSSCVALASVLLPLLLLCLLSLVLNSNQSTSLWSPSWLSPTYSDSAADAALAEAGAGGVVIRTKESAAAIQASLVSPNDIPATRFLLPPAAAPAAAPGPEPGKDVDELKDKAQPPSSIRVRRRNDKLERLESNLARARAAIRAVAQSPNKTFAIDKDYVPVGPVYRNPYAFHRSYLEMEKLFKVYVYEEGEPPLFHDGPCRSIYSMEGRFIHNMEMGNRFRTRDPHQAHVHFLPFSVVKMVKFIYKPKTFDISPLERTIVDYIRLVSSRYPFWNRSLGADHFMLSCHDWGPHASRSLPELYSRSIRVLCNANTSEGFRPEKDVSLPEINLKTGGTAGIIGGLPVSRRSTLAFFAGGVHGPIRPVLLRHWKDRGDPEMQVYEYLPKGMDYYGMMRKSRFCLCPSGYEVASPRVVEAIYLECVPVIISENYSLPFADVLNWRSFSVQVSLGEIPRLKEILAGISTRQYIRMWRRVKVVQRHFVLSSRPERYDVFHMILHSVWLRRLNIRVLASGS